MQVGAGGASSSTAQPNNSSPAAVAERVAVDDDDGASIPSSQSGSLEEMSTIGLPIEAVDGGRAMVDGIVDTDARIPPHSGRSVGQRIKASLNANHDACPAGTGAAANGNSAAAQGARHW